MVEIELKYKDESIFLQCDENDILKNILEKSNKEKLPDISSLHFLYSGNIIDINFSFSQLATKIDKERKKMSILVYDSKKKNDESFISPNPICGTCGQNVKIKLIDYKVVIYPCVNGHKDKILFLKDYEQFQNLFFLKKLKCDICQENDIKYFYCYNCKNKFCSSCKEKHQSDHSIINYDSINYICQEHKEPFNSYSKKSFKNLCPLCIQGNNDHENILYEKIPLNIDEHKIKIKELKKDLNKFNKEVEEIIRKLHNVLKGINIYFSIIEDMINNFNIKKTNYEIINNINEINYDIIINDLTEINSEINEGKKVDEIIKINNKMEKIYNFKYLIDLRADDTNFQNTIWNYWGNKGNAFYSGRENYYDQEWEKGYPLLIKSHLKLLDLLEKNYNLEDKSQIINEIKKLPENIPLSVGTHYIFFNTKNEYVCRDGTTKFLKEINQYQLNYYKKIRNYAIKFLELRNWEILEDKNYKEIKDFENNIPNEIINLYHDGHGGNIPLKFPLVEDKPFLYVRRQKTNESDTHVKDLLPFGKGVIVVKKEFDEN